MGSHIWRGGTLVLVLVLLLSACGAPAAPATGSQPAAAQDSAETMEEVAAEGGELIFGLSTEPPNMDPQVGKGTAARTVKVQVYRGLVSFHKDGEIIMDLAESVEQPDDVTYVFKLRDNANWHNGDPVTAEDVKFSLERILDPETGATTRTQLSVIETIEVVDEKTVQLTLSQPTAAFLSLLAIAESAIVSKNWVEAGNDLDADMMGAGPFKFVEREKGVRIVLEKNPDYYQEGYPKLDKLTFVPYRDENLRVTALKTGDVDIIEYVPWKDMVAIDADPNLKLETTVGPFMYLIFNPDREPFNNPQVRKAIGYAIDRQGVLDAAFVGRGSQLFGLPVPENSWLYDESLVNFWDYNPDKAKELLAEAGYPDGFKAKLLSTATYDMHEQTAVVVADSLSKIGIEVELELPEWGARVEQGNAGEYDFAVMGSGAAIIDPDWLTDYYSVEGIRYGRVPNWSNSEVDRLLGEAASVQDQDERIALYKEFAAIALEEAPYVWLTWREQGYAYQNGIEGFQNIPFLTFNSGITLEEVSVK